jgi:hypothetical protein
MMAVNNAKCTNLQPYFSIFVIFFEMKLNFFFCVLVSVIFTLPSFSQCSVSSTSGTPYTVNVSLEPVAIIAPTSCPWGYTYNVEISYDIVFSGTPQGNLYTLQGYLTCGSSSNLYFDLPNDGKDSSGTSTTTSNPWTGDNDCATTTVSDRQCVALDLEIQGPGISNQRISCNASSTLPIELGSFTLSVESNKRVLFFWETLSEINNDYFSIEKSINGKEWEVIGKVNGAGNSSKKLNYKYVDVAGIDEATYYRLKQTDYDGKFKYFSPIFGNVNKNSSEELVVYPNPFNESLTVEAAEENIDQVQIYSLDGKPLVNNSVGEILSNGKVVFNLGDLKPGMYLVRCNENVQRIFKK